MKGKSESYFEFFGIPLSFFPDDQKLRDAFYANSKKFHPDFFTRESSGKQDEILELSSLNNKAYMVLSDFDSRMRYILLLYGMLEEESEKSLTTEFLSEMMEINEAIMDLEMRFQKESFLKLYDKVRKMEHQMLNNIHPFLKKFEGGGELNDLIPVKEFYLRRRYLLRILENLDRFAAA
jgi:molecular chaperone HscB